MKTRRMVEALYDALGAAFIEGISRGDRAQLPYDLSPKRVEQAALRAATGARLGALTDRRLALLLEHLGLEIETIEAGERLVKKAKRGRKA